MPQIAERPSRPLRVVIGATDGRYRQELRHQFTTDPGFEVIADTEDGEEALSLVRGLRPAVAVFDADLRTFGGNALARILATELPDVRVVVLD